MKVHIRVHTNDRPYHCPFKEICHQAFKTKSQLSDHLLKHTQIKRFTCEKCGTCFARKSRLKIHLMIHSNLKPFQCEICKKKFREKSNYNFHKKKHYKNNGDKKNQKRLGFNKSSFKRIEKRVGQNYTSDHQIEISLPEKENCNINNPKNNNFLMAMNDMDFCFNPENKKTKLAQDFEDLFNDKINQECVDPNRTNLNSEERILKKMNDSNFIDQEKDYYLEENSEDEELSDNNDNIYDNDNNYNYNNNYIIKNQSEGENNVINNNLAEEDFYPYPNEL